MHATKNGYAPGYKPSPQRYRHGLTSLSGALERYTRLCRDPESGPYNVFGALILVHEALVHAPRRWIILQYVVEADRQRYDLTSRNVAQAFGLPLDLAGTELLWLWHHEFLQREVAVVVPKGREYLYWPSPFGRMVVELDPDAHR